MKSVALTEGKKAYFYDLNRQPGIKRNFSPKMRHAAGLQRQPGTLEWQRAEQGAVPGSREWQHVAAGPRCVKAHTFPHWLGRGSLQPRTCFGFMRTFALSF